VAEEQVELLIEQRKRRGIRFASVRRLLPPSSRGTWLSLAVAAVVTVGVAGAIARRTGPELPEGGPRAAEQAATVDALLSQSTAGRQYLLTAIEDINACAVTDTTVATIRRAARARWELLALVDDTVVTDLPHGVAIKTDFRRAVRASYDADEAYLDWVLAAGRRCPTQGDPTYAAVTTANSAARATKRAFLDRWNPVAVRYGLDPRSATVV
jgi:hypothetical protein